MGCEGSAGSAAGGDALTLGPHVEDRFVVGQAEGGLWDSFSRITSVAFDRAGRLHILDADESRVSVVETDGTLVRQFGSRGEGPGQFRMPQALAVLPSGEIVVSDAGHRSVLVFGPDGEYRRAVAIPDGMGGANLLFAHGDDGVVFASRGITVTSRGGSPVMPTDIPIRRMFVAGEREGEVEVLDRAWTPPRELPTAGRSMSLQGQNQQIRMPVMGMMRAFDPQLHLTVLPDGRLAVADTSSYRVRIVSPEGEPQGVVERPVAPHPVGEAEREAERERRMRDLEEGGGPQIRIAISDGSSTQSFDQGSMREMLEAQIQNLEFWPEIPVIEALSADRQGRLWVRRSAGVGESGPIDVLTPDGEVLGQIRAGELGLPHAFGPDGLVAWIERDELEIPRVRVARLTGIPS